MLILTRRPGEEIVIDGGIRIVVLGVNSGCVVRVGIDAPKSVSVLRKEIANSRDEGNKETSQEETELEPVGAAGH